MQHVVGRNTRKKGILLQENLPPAGRIYPGVCLRKHGPGQPVQLMVTTLRCIQVREHEPFPWTNNSRYMSAGTSFRLRGRPNFLLAAQIRASEILSPPTLVPYWFVTSSRLDHSFVSALKRRKKEKCYTTPVRIELTILRLTVARLNQLGHGVKPYIRVIQ